MHQLEKPCTPLLENILVLENFLAMKSEQKCLFLENELISILRRLRTMALSNSSLPEDVDKIREEIAKIEHCLAAGKVKLHSDKFSIIRLFD